MTRFVAILLLGLVLFASAEAQAHEVRPAYLELTERASGDFDVLWKVPARGGVPIAGEEIPHETTTGIQPPGAGPHTMNCGCPAPTLAQLTRGVLPIHPSFQNAQPLAPPQSIRLPGAELRRWSIRMGPQGLEGSEIRVHGLPATMVDVLVRIALADGRVVSRLLRPEAPSFIFRAADAGPAARGYLKLGVEHILLGVDHLLFVACLLLLVRGLSSILKTITAFTVAHSITLGLAALGHVRLPPAPVEAVIALSIVFLATEVAKRRNGIPSLTERQPWLVAFVFGLLHGFGFAGALGEIGLPNQDIPLALLLFNVGVELGQLLFVAAVLSAIALIRRWATRIPARLQRIPAYGIGSIASYWLIARLTTLW
ncbi:MAG: HupE/UreJ family protein [Verrucomicrobiales bacterium]|nr:HupE/UreJ family protein [Verrucomicrobiales bacterium]